MKLDDFWPYDTVKESWLAAMSLLKDGKRDDVEVDWGDDEWRTCDFSMAYKGLLECKIRPIHKHRWLAEKYEKGQKWQHQSSMGQWVDCNGYAVNDPWPPSWNKFVKYRPHPSETELFKWYEENKP